jgi:hypothetical protein
MKRDDVRAMLGRSLHLKEVVVPVLHAEGHSPLVRQCRIDGEDRVPAELRA